MFGVMSILLGMGNLPKTILLLAGLHLLSTWMLLKHLFFCIQLTEIDPKCRSRLSDDGGTTWSADVFGVVPGQAANGLGGPDLGVMWTVVYKELTNCSLKPQVLQGKLRIAKVLVTRHRPLWDPPS
jgi:hypothetical protein